MNPRRRPEVVVSGGSFGGRGGVETHVGRWCAEFAQRGWNVTLVVSASDTSRLRLAAIGRLGIRCIDLRAGNSWNRALRASVAALSLRRCNAIFYSHGRGGIAPFLGRIMRPAVWVHHHHVNYACGDLIGWPRTERRMLSRVEHVVMCSRVHAQRLAADLGNSKALFLPYLKSEGQLLTPPNSPSATVLYMGLMRESKGVPLLLSLGSWFERNNSRLVLWGRDAEGLMNANLPSGIVWRGEYDPECDLDAILGEAACLALPFKEGEGLPIVISEALSRGVPIATFGFSGIEWLRGLHPGLAVVDGSSEQLTREIQRLVRIGRDLDFRRSLRDAYFRCLGNERCIEWWSNLTKHGN